MYFLRAHVAVLLIFTLSCGARRAAVAPRPAAIPATLAPAPAPQQARAAWREAKGVFDRRCVVCHGCYDAPCQLILSSHEGMARGGSKHEVYDAARLLASEPTRLHIDAHGLPAWRERGFHPVLPEGQPRDPRTSVLLRMLDLKRRHPLQVGGVLSDKDFSLGLDREQVCPTSEEFDDYEKEHPGWGMPYALPGLTDDEHAALVRWVEAGAPSGDDPFPPAALEASIARWEEFLNQPGNKSQLMSRYIYEHLFLASLYFEKLDERTFFRLVRSRTRPGQPIVEIPTRRPYDDPGKDPFYYRLKRRETTVLAKTHMPYPLSDARLAHFRKLFLVPDYEVKAMPSYELAVGANPFAAFGAIPVASRYRFMLEEAHFTISGFIKGPVCRGQIALDVIEDRFWMAFVDPDSPVIVREAELLARLTPDLGLPAEQGSNNPLLTWNRYARRARRVVEEKSKFLGKLAETPDLITMKQIWNGDGQNPNAALTVMRHFDSATVVRGFVGGPPKTMWVVGYALLERIHYLLVAGFDVFGNIGHQLHSRMYMDFLRMEGESNFLLFLPRARRRAMVEAWYRETSGKVKDQVYGKVAYLHQETGVPYRTNRPEQELFGHFTTHVQPVLNLSYGLGEERDQGIRRALEPLALTYGVPASLLPETSYLEVRSPAEEPRYFTILRDSAHTNVAQLFREDARRRPQEDHLTVLRGFVGVYPNALFSVARAELDAFVADVQKLDAEPAYEALRARYGVRRTDAQFWALSDRMHSAFEKLEPLEHGLLDFNRLDSR